MKSKHNKDNQKFWDGKNTLYSYDSDFSIGKSFYPNEFSAEEQYNTMVMGVVELASPGI